MRRIATLAALLALTACSSPAPPAPAPAPPPQASRPPPPPVAPVSRPDQCGAQEAQRLVGRPRTEIPIPVDPSRQRVACTTCPVTQDFRADRLNFFFDAQTGLIREVRCG